MVNQLKVLWDAPEETIHGDLQLIRINIFQSAV